MFTKTIQKTMFAGVLAMGFNGAAQAGGFGCSYQECDTYCEPVCVPVYKWVTCYETRCVPKTICVTEYDCHGCPVVFHRTIEVKVRVAFQKRVRVA